MRLTVFFGGIGFGTGLGAGVWMGARGFANVSGGGMGRGRPGLAGWGFFAGCAFDVEATGR